MTNLLLIILLILVTVGLSLVLFTLRAKLRIEAALPPQGRFVDVPNARLHVVEQGTGPAILLIHGLAGNLRHFSYGVMQLLAEDYRVVAVDRPGSGYSLRPGEASASLSSQADVMAALIDKLELERPVVVGHSLGGAIALALAQRHPQKVAALALVAPLTHAVANVSPAFRGLMISQPWLRRIVAWTLAVPGGIRHRDQILALAFGPESVPAEFATRGGGLLNARPSHFIAASTDLAAAPEDLPEMENRYTGMDLVVGVLYGRGDRILNPLEQGPTLVSKVPGAQLVLIDGGHMLPLTQPAVTAGFIREVAARANS